MADFCGFLGFFDCKKHCFCGILLIFTNFTRIYTKIQFILRLRHQVAACYNFWQGKKRKALLKIFSKFVFVAVMGAFSLCAAWAYETCNPGQYLKCDWDPWNGACTDCGCANCPIGQTSDGTGVVYNCPGVPSGDSGCHDAGYCADYTDECPAGVPVAQYRKCKQVTIECGGVAGCSGYALCNTTNGASAGYFIPYDSDVCHMEGSVCYGNTRACSEFGVLVDYGKWTCDKGDQTGNAKWTPTENAWDTSGCACTVTNKNIDIDDGNTVIKCEKANAEYVVSEENKFSTTRATYPVYYTAKRQYCSKCYPGYLPFVEPSPDNGVYLSPVDSSAYGVRVCKNMVTAPYYTTGCDIIYPLNNNPGANMCRLSCPANMETLANGATSQGDCVPDNATTYQDSTGTFKLGTTQCQ